MNIAEKQHTFVQHPLESKVAMDSSVGQAVKEAGYWANSAAMREEVARFAMQADDLANSILRVRPAHSPKPAVINHYYTWWPWWSPWWEPRTVVYVSNDRYRNDDHQVLLCMLGTAAAVITGVGMYLTGNAVGRYQDAGQGIEETSAMMQKLNEFAANNAQEEREFIQEAINTAIFKERIHFRIKNSSIADIAIRVGLIVGGILTTTGSFSILAGLTSIAAASLTTMGVIVGLVAGGGMLFKYGFDSSSKMNKLDALSLQNSVAQLKIRLASEFDHQNPISLT